MHMIVYIYLLQDKAELLDLWWWKASFGYDYLHNKNKNKWYMISYFCTSIFVNTLITSIIIIIADNL